MFQHLKKSLFLLTRFSSENVPHIYKVPKDYGPCSESQIYFYYGLEKWECKTFLCDCSGGNTNHSCSIEDCMETSKIRHESCPNHNRMANRKEAHFLSKRKEHFIVNSRLAIFHTVVFLFTSVVRENNSPIQRWLIPMGCVKWHCYKHVISHVVAV